MTPLLKEITLVINAIVIGSGKKIDPAIHPQMAKIWEQQLSVKGILPEQIMPLYHYALAKKTDWNSFGIADLLRHYDEFIREKELKKILIDYCVICNGLGYTINLKEDKLCWMCHGRGTTHYVEHKVLKNNYLYEVKNNLIGKNTRMPVGQVQGMRLETIRKFYLDRYEKIGENPTVKEQFPDIYEYIREDLNRN